ncbi:MAG: polysaccharide biosynthesis protein [Gemmataceae bacterium]|nr:polysaccharide biosynthesis protein [Gemmataceae bacterium]
MNRDPVLIRVDATPRTGYEHLARCLIFAAALQRRRRPTYFLGQIEPTTLGFVVKRGGNEWLSADAQAGTPDDLAETLQEVRRLRPAAILVDAPQVTEGYLTELLASTNLLVSMDHSANVRFPSHLIINPLLAPGKENYDFLPGAQLLLGPRYALVRSEIRRQRQGRAQEPPPVPVQGGKAGAGQYRVLVSLGEDDPNRQAPELTRLLLGVPRIARVDVAVRSHHPDLEALRALAEAHPERLEVAVEPAEVAARVARCHFAITSGSGWSLELACVGVPQLVVVQTESHWPTAQRLEEEGCATCLGWHANVSATTIRQAVQNLLNDPLERQAMARCARKLIDGRGPDRLVTALEVMLHPSRLMDFSEAA